MIYNEAETRDLHLSMVVVIYNEVETRDLHLSRVVVTRMAMD
jgi:hypothetical protein